MKKAYVLTMCIFLLFPLSNYAEDAMENDDNTTDIMIDPNCLDSNDVCFNRAVEKEKLVQQCADNPEWCEQRRERLKQRRDARQALKAQCEVQPDQCDQLTKTFRQQQKQLVESQQTQWCTDNPERCEQWKVDQKALRAQCQTLRRQIADKYPDRP